MNLRKTLLITTLGLALAGCGNDADPPATTASAPGPQSGADGSPGPGPASAPKLVASEPASVSIEGATGVNDDCNIEGVDRQLFTSATVTVPQGGTHAFAGWIVDKAGNAIPTRLKLVVTGVGSTSGLFTTESVTWVDRAGVSETRGYGPELNKSGFVFNVDTTDVPAGRYHIFVTGAGATGAVVCDPGRQIVIEG